MAHICELWVYGLCSFTRIHSILCKRCPCFKNYPEYLWSCGPLLILPPALKRWGPPRRQGFFPFALCVCNMSSKQSYAEGTEAGTKKSATMSPVGTDDTLRIRMQCTFIAWLFVTLYP